MNDPASARRLGGAAALVSGSASAGAGVLVLLACHVPVLFGAWCLAGRLTQRASHRRIGAADLVLTGLIYFAGLIALGLFLGRVGALARIAAIFSAAMLGLAMMRIGRRFARVPIRRPRTLSAASVAVAMLVAVIALVASSSLVHPAYEYDVLTYHLLFPARWIQDGAISIIPTWFGDPAPAYAPSATEVYYLWLMLPFGEDLVARGGQFPFWILLLCAAHALGRELRLRPGQRAAATLALALIPAIAAQAATAMVDVAFAAHLVAVALFSLRTGRTRRTADAVGLILALGLLIGTKFIALAYVPTILPLLVWPLLRCLRRPGGRGPLRRHPPPEARRRTRLLVGVAFTISAWIGGYFYARNWSVTDNPVYPLEVRLGSATLLQGAYGRAQMENSVFNVRRRAEPDVLGRTFWEAVHTPDAPWPAADRDGTVSVFRYWYVGPLGLIFAASGVAVILALRRSPRRTPTLLFYASVAALWLVFWFALPFQQPRFAFGPIALAVIGAAAAARAHRHAPTALLLLAAMAWTIAFAGDLRGFVTAASSTGSDPRTRAMADWPFLGEAWTWIDENLHHVTIAYAGNNVPYFLCGRRLNNRVLYVPARRPPEGRYHDFAALPESRALGPPNTSEPACDRYLMDPAVWLDNLRALRVDYVLVNAMFPNLLLNHRHDLHGYPIERRWLDALCQAPTGEAPPAQCRVFANGNVRLYRLRRRDLPASIPTFARVTRDETDALDRLRQDHTPPGRPIRDYPHARAVIERSDLRPLGP